MNRDTMKYIAVFTMTCNHIARMFLTPGNFSYEILSDIGYFAAMTMCFFLVEGYYCSHDRKKYALRLLIFAILSQIPYHLAFHDGQLNMLFTLWICFVLIDILNRPFAQWERTTAILFLFFMSFLCCWKIVAPLAVYLFVKYRGRKQELMKSCCIITGLFVLLNFSTYLNDFSISKAAYLALGNGLGMALSQVVLLCYYNGEKSTKHTMWNRWFFYIFYPAHLLILCSARAIVK